MTTRFWRHIGLVLAAICALATTARAITLADLEPLLQSEPPGTVSFEEIHESPWLATPVKSSGVLVWDPPMLEKRVLSPRQETWRLYPDHMEWIGSGGTGYREIRFDESPELAALANAIRGAVTGDMAGLEKDFYVVPDGNENRWSVKLTLRRPETSRNLDSIVFSGERSQVRMIVVSEQEGERTTIRLAH